MAGRVSQETVQAAELGTPDARASQVDAETLASGTPEARSGQVVAETSGSGTPEGRAGQVVAEVIGEGAPKFRASQVVVEVLLRSIFVPTPPIYPDLPGLTFPVVRRIIHPVQSQKTATLGSVDIAIADSPVYEWDLIYSVLRGGWGPGSIEYATMFGFNLRLNGNAGRFLFREPHDNKVKDQYIATTDGTTAVFSPIVRTFGVGDNSGTEAVGYVDATQQINVYLDEVWQPPDTWQILYTVPVKQQLKFFNTPAAGKKITMDFSFFYYCKFLDNKMEFEEFVWDMHEMKKITIESLRPGN